MSNRESSELEPQNSGVLGRSPVVWFHVIGAALLTVPQLLLGSDNSVCTAWNTWDMAGAAGLSCAAKTYIALLVGLSALWLTIFAIPTADEARSVAQPQSLQLAGLSARFAVFFAVSIVALETLARSAI